MTFHEFSWLFHVGLFMWEHSGVIGSVRALISENISINKRGFPTNGNVSRAVYRKRSRIPSETTCKMKTWKNKEGKGITLGLDEWESRHKVMIPKRSKTQIKYWT